MIYFFYSFPLNFFITFTFPSITARPKVLLLPVSVTLKPTPFASAAVTAPTTSKRKPAPNAVTLLPACVPTTGAPRLREERPPELAVCATWRICHAASRTVSVKELLPSPVLLLPTKKVWKVKKADGGGAFLVSWLQFIIKYKLIKLFWAIFYCFQAACDII